MTLKIAPQIGMSVLKNENRPPKPSEIWILNLRLELSLKKASERECTRVGQTHLDLPFI
jgi:hypothetical protein